MFKVTYYDEILIVYGINSTGSNFLVYRKNKWEWVSIESTKPI